MTPRHNLVVPVELDNAVGVTRDLCTTGVFFTTERDYALGAELEFTIVLDTLNSDKPLRMRCSGEVVRVEEFGEAFGVAAKISDFSIQT